MNGYLQDIEAITVENQHFRRVLYTAPHCQLVVMALLPREEIGEEVHTLDQFFRVEEGTGTAVLDGTRTAIHAGWAVVVPAGARHNIINTSAAPMKLYTLYAPPNHLDGVVHHTRADAEADDEHYDGRTTEATSSPGEDHMKKTTDKKPNQALATLERNAAAGMKRAAQATGDLVKEHPVATAGALLGAGLLAGVAAQRALGHKPTVGEVIFDALKAAPEESRKAALKAARSLKKVTSR